MKKIYTLLFLFIGLVTVRGDEPHWINWPARRNSKEHGEVLSDILSHVKDIDRGYSDDETIAHENTHGIAADIRWKYTSAYNGVYCLHNRAIVWKEPEGITLRAALAGVPRGQVASATGWAFDSWDDQPLYLFDESNAYLNGAKCALELHIEPAQVKHDFEAIEEFERYDDALISYIEIHKSDYKDLTSLKDWLYWYKESVNQLKPK